MIPELLTDDVGSLDDLLAEPVPDEADVLLARRLLIALGQINAKRAEVKRTLAAVRESYERRILAYDQAEASIRSSLVTYVERHGKLSLPDAGSCYFQTRTSKPRIVDPEAALAWAIENLPAAVRNEPTLVPVDYVDEALMRLEGTGEVLPGFDSGGEESRSLVVKAAR